MRIKIIANPTSGRVKAKKHLPLIKEILSKNNTLDFNFTQKKDDAFNFALKANPEKFDSIVVAGGDGTLNEVINGMLKAGYSLEFRLVLLRHAM